MIDIQRKAESLLQIGLAEALKRNYDAAIKSIEEAQRFFHETGNISQVAVCLAELAVTLYQSNKDRLIRSLTLLNDAKALVHNQPANANVEAKILHYYGIIYYSEKRLSEALKYFRNAKKLADNNSIEYAKILDKFAIYYLRINNYPVASKYIKESLRIKQELDNQYEIALTKLLFGRYLASVESHEEALAYLSSALEITQGFGDNGSAARIQDELAKIYLAMEDYKAAEELCLKSIDLAKLVKAPLIYAFSYCTLANIKIATKEPEKAINIIETEVNPVFLDLVTVRGFAIAKRSKALAHFHLGQLKEAIDNLQESIELFKEVELTAEIAKSYYELSQIYKKSGDIPMALSSILEAFKITKSSNSPILSKKIEDFIFEIDQDEWASIINKTTKKEIEFIESKPDIDVLSLIGDIIKTDKSPRDPLLSLLRIGRSIAAETDVDKLLEIIAEETKIALNADRCTVFLLDRETNELWSKVALGMGKQEIRFPAHMGLAGHVATTGETINIKEAYNDHRFNKEIDKKTGYRTKTILCMPMKDFNQKTVGVFQVLNKLGDQVFTEADEDLLVAIGSSAGIALENADLFKKQQLMFEEQNRSFISFINTLAASIDARDKITAGHSTRVTGYAVAIARQMELDQEDIEVLEYAALLHDFGKIGIKDSVLCKEGKLDDAEYRHIQEHAYLTNEILKNMYFAEKFKDVPEIASSHHEKFNGMGYFRGAKGEEIPLGGRILAVADVFDAITSKRHYRGRMPILQALDILRKDSGSHFDNKIVDEFFDITIERILKVMLSKYDAPLTVAETLLFSKYTMNQLHQMLLKDPSQRTELEKQIVDTFEKHYNPPPELEELADLL